jgi:hypothetical protein
MFETQGGGVLARTGVCVTNRNYKAPPLPAQTKAAANKYADCSAAIGPLWKYQLNAHIVVCACHAGLGWTL